MHPGKKSPRARRRPGAAIAALLAAALLAPAAARGDDELDAFLRRPPGESTFGRARVVESIGDIGSEEAIRALVDLFADDELRWMAVRQLAQLRTAAVPALLDALRSPSPDTVRFAAYTLGEIRAPQAVPALVPLLAHDVPAVRQHAAYALCMIRDRAATDALIGSLKDPEVEAVEELVNAEVQANIAVSPAEMDLQAALKKTGYQHLSVTVNNELIKDIPDLTINLSAVAKGFGVDEMTRVLERRGYTNISASIAGEVRLLGRNPRGAKWKIGISAPVSNWREDYPMVAVANLSDRAISTSRDYQKFFFDARGRRLCHIFDAATVFDAILCHAAVRTLSRLPTARAFGRMKPGRHGCPQ